jgi:hypothetical protein
VDEPSVEEKLGTLLGHAKTSVANHKAFMDRMVCAWILGLMCLWAVVAVCLVYLLHADPASLDSARPLLLAVLLLYTIGCCATFYLMEASVGHSVERYVALEFAVYENHGLVLE